MALEARGLPGDLLHRHGGLASGAVLSFNDHWALVFNLFLSIAAMLLAGVILVAGARHTGAIQIELDELIRRGEHPEPVAER